MVNKLEELASVENLVREKLPEKERSAMMGRVVSRMISAMAKHLIKRGGYTIAAKVMRRELRETGRNDARTMLEIFKFEKNPENASRTLKIAAIVLGLKLECEGSETVVKDCPLGKEAMILKQPIICNFCIEYINGVIEEILGEDFHMERINWVFNGDRYCAFKLRRI